jgi:hypothetical protein
MGNAPIHILVSLLIAALTAPAGAQPAPLKPYKAVTVVTPAPVTDPALDALRKQAGEAAQKKDRAALRNSWWHKASSGNATAATAPTSADPAWTIWPLR